MNENIDITTESTTTTDETVVAEARVSKKTLKVAAIASAAGAAVTGLAFLLTRRTRDNVDVEWETVDDVEADTSTETDN